MMDSNSPTIPARPVISKSGSEHAASIPVIPERPRKQTKSPRNSEAKDDSKESTKISLGSELDNSSGKTETIGISETESFKNDEFAGDSQVSNSADILSEIVSELAKDSPIDEKSESQFSQEHLPKTLPETKSIEGFELPRAVVDSSKVPTTVKIANEKETAELENLPDLHAPEERANETKENKELVTKIFDGPATPEENKSVPVVPTRPRKSDKTDSAKAQLSPVSNFEIENVNSCATKTEPLTPSDENTKESISSTSQFTTDDASEGTPESAQNATSSESVEKKTELTKVPGTADSLKNRTDDETKPSDEVTVIEDKNSAPKNVEISTQPVIPKRPTRTSTPKIPKRPLGQKQDAVADENATKDDTESSTVSSKKAPPPKPKKLSSKIAAFQQMFNQTPLEHTFTKPSPAERGKLSSNQTDFASNLESMMGRGHPLPGMANPDMLQNLPTSENLNEPDTVISTGATTTANIPRRARGPRGKRLPKSIQETKIEVKPRFQISVSEVWEVKFKKSSISKVLPADTELHENAVAEEHDGEFSKASSAKKYESENEADIGSKEKFTSKSDLASSSDMNRVKPENSVDDLEVDSVRKNTVSEEKSTIHQSEEKIELGTQENETSSAKETVSELEKEKKPDDTSLEKGLPDKILPAESSSEDRFPKGVNPAKEHLSELKNTQVDSKDAAFADTKPDMKFSIRTEMPTDALNMPLCPNDADTHESES